MGVNVAGGPYLVAVGQAIPLDGTGSSDPDGDALTYQWEATGGPVSDSDFTAGDQAGIFEVTLTVYRRSRSADRRRLTWPPSTTFTAFYRWTSGRI